MNEYNTLKLCDFGLSKKLTDLVKKKDEAAPDNSPKSGTPYHHFQRSVQKVLDLR